MNDPETVLCVPGLWKDRSELVTRIARDSGGYLFAGGVLMNQATGDSFELQVEEPDPRIVKAFQAVGGHWVTPEDLAQLAAHTFVLYLVAPGGSGTRAAAAMGAVGGLLRAGGLAVKVESAGVAHARSAWLDHVDTTHLFSAFRAFVVVVTGDPASSSVYSCGMHNLGYRDAIIAAGDAADPVELLRAFNFYQFTEKPTLRDGETFGVARGAPGYRLFAEPCALYGGEPLYTNPYGMWRLRPKD